MTNLFRSREDAIADDDVKTQLVTLGSQTSPGPLLVPGAATHLRAARVAATSNHAAVGAGAYLVRLEGPGIARGNFVFAAGADGVSVATGGHTNVPATRVPINIAVIPGQEVLVFAEQLGTDLGSSEVAVTLEFGTEAGPEGEVKAEVTVEGDITTVNTLTRLTTQGSVASPSRLTPPDATLLKRAIVAIAHDGAADGNVSFLLRFSGDAIKGGEQTFVIGAGGYIDVGAGGDAGNGAGMLQILDNLDLEITPNETLDIAIEMAGTDIGTATAVVTAVFA